MIKFFRKIRYDLMEKNKTGKYLKYAVGEIVLVVIGILIALSINNWNELQKLKQTEIDIIKGIKSDLIQDTIDINYNANSYKRLINSDSILLDHIMEKKSFNEEFMNRFVDNVNSDLSAILHRAHFDELKLKGLNIISNENLRGAISRLYEFHYTVLIFSENSDKYFNHYELTTNELSRYLERNSSVTSMKPETYNALMEDSHAHYIIWKSMSMKKQILNDVYNPIIIHVNELISLINKELDN
jgi:hypothetical protein